MKWDLKRISNLDLIVWLNICKAGSNLILILLRK
jgi:hypothetical protein